ncbi:hypothetical protein CGI54_11555 [Vibrio parahaemolyticus]|nr:hypothetical protein CGI54_11555 [Vibrio parahaemolyticus]
MYIFGYLRASTSDQNAKRAQGALQEFAQQKGFRIAGWYRGQTTIRNILYAKSVTLYL